ncbi:hypothetical protein SteCoe_13194 [Stentor coeruleus]|uniref:Uncharacterized protein n=1 Tax=Stentor coeruleus TaxID=5963 RepID=A0A1R2C906_9CILI|nr:hypothetical protein SteCoe_13194 [Stentor coeruleus]
MSLVVRNAFSPFQSNKGKSLQSGLNINFRSRHGKVSPLRSRVLMQKYIQSEKTRYQPTSSISTTDSVNSKNPQLVEEEFNVMITPTTIQDEHIGTEELNEFLDMYFNCNRNIEENKKHASMEISESKRYKKIQHTKFIKPIRSETPEIPTRRHKTVLKDKDKLPLVEKKVGRSKKSLRSPSPYDLKGKTKSKIDNSRNRSPLNIIRIRL